MTSDSTQSRQSCQRQSCGGLNDLGVLSVVKWVVSSGDGGGAILSGTPLDLVWARCTRR